MIKAEPLLKPRLTVWAWEPYVGQLVWAKQARIIWELGWLGWGCLAACSGQLGSILVMGNLPQRRNRFRSIQCQIWF